MKRLITFLVMFAMLVLMATPVMAGTFDTIAGCFGPIGSALAWIAEVTGAEAATVNWSVGGLLTLVFGWILKKYNVEQWGLGFHRNGWFIGRKISQVAKTVKYIGPFWDKFIEHFIIKTITTIPHLITQWINGIVAGLLSDNEAPNKAK